MQVVTEAMTKQQEAFMKVLEDRDASQCRNKAMGGRESQRMLLRDFLECEPPEFAGIADPGKCTYWIRGMERVIVRERYAKCITELYGESFMVDLLPMLVGILT